MFLIYVTKRVFTMFHLNKTIKIQLCIDGHCGLKNHEILQDVSPHRC